MNEFTLAAILLLVDFIAGGLAGGLALNAWCIHRGPRLGLGQHFDGRISQGMRSLNGLHVRGEHRHRSLIR